MNVTFSNARAAVHFVIRTPVRTIRKIHQAFLDYIKAIEISSYTDEGGTKL